MLKAVNLRPGNIITFKGSLHEVIEYQHIKPGKGPAFVRAKFRNLDSGAIFQETLRPDDSFQDAFIEQKNMQYLYRDDMGYCLMDTETYEQIHVPETVLGEKAEFLKENMEVTVKMHEGKILSVEPPIHVVLKVVQTDPGFKGDTVSGATKPATLETGKVVKVPLFVEQDTLIKVDTRTGEYVERA
ncbi:MAG: elongation factor P [Candidatus Omnitrophica bacterium]|nr:elongation factor P [Candidatus Omnitrophota bacterium]